MPIILHTFAKKYKIYNIIYIFLIYDIRFTLIVLGSNPLLIIVETLGLSEKKKKKHL